MNSYYLSIIWIHTPTLTYEVILSLSYEFISFVDDMNSYTYLSYEFIYYFNDMNSYFLFIHHVNSYILFQSIPTTLTILQMESSIPENCIVASVSNLLRLTSGLNCWTSNFVMTHGDQSIDVFSAAQGALSSSPSGTYPHQIIQCPCTKYYFDDFFLVLMRRIYW
jgi:hypothetical protein